MKPKNLRKSETYKKNKTSLFDLMKGHYFGEDLTYQDFQRSGLIHLEKGKNLIILIKENE